MSQCSYSKIKITNPSKKLKLPRLKNPKITMIIWEREKFSVQI